MKRKGRSPGANAGQTVGNEGKIKNKQDADAPRDNTRVERAEARTEQAEARAEQAEARSEQAIRASELSYRRLFESGEGRHSDSGR